MCVGLPRPQFNHTRLVSASGVVAEAIYHNYYRPPRSLDGTLPSSAWGHCVVGSPDVDGSGKLFSAVHNGCSAPQAQPAEFRAFDKVLAFFEANAKRL